MNWLKGVEMFKVGDVVVCVDNASMETKLSNGEKYVVDKVYDEDHICVKGFSGIIHSDRFYKEADSCVQVGRCV